MVDQQVETNSNSTNSHQGRDGNIGRPFSGFRIDWKCCSVAALGLLVFALLFQPWLAATGPYGEVHSDAFGRVDGSVPLLQPAGERPTEGVVTISGVWGALSATAALLTVFGLLLALRSRAGLFLLVGASAANAVLVPATLLHLDGKAPQMRAMTEEHDEIRTALLGIVNTFFGNDTQGAGEAAQQEATAALTNQGLACGFAAFAAAALALSMWGRVRATLHDVRDDIRADIRDYEEVSSLCVEQETSIGYSAAPAPVPAPESHLEYAVSLYVDPHPEWDCADPQYHHEEDRTQRILPRGTRPGYPRREQQTVRRARPRPTKRTGAQSATGTLRNGRSAQSLTVV